MTKSPQRFPRLAARLGPKTLPQLIGITDGAQLFHTESQRGYITIRVDKHQETLPIRSKAFKSWLLREFYRKWLKTVPSDVLETALNVLDAKAVFDGPAIAVHTRVAEASNGNIYLDLANDNWQVVEIHKTGYRVLNHSPVKFVRPKSMRALPYPQEGGSLDDLRPFLNVATEDDSSRSLRSWLPR